MREHDMTEQAYKNGYAKGFEDGKKAVEVVHGNWGKPFKVDADHFGHKCSECGYYGVPCWHYCPHCGAKMEG